jgi:hypothetical protein
VNVFTDEWKEMVPGRVPNDRRKYDLRLKMSKGKFLSGQYAIRLKKKRADDMNIIIPSTLSTSPLILKKIISWLKYNTNFNLEHI